MGRRALEMDSMDSYAEDKQTNIQKYVQEVKWGVWSHVKRLKSLPVYIKLNFVLCNMF